VILSTLPVLLFWTYIFGADVALMSTTLDIYDRAKARYCVAVLWEGGQTGKTGCKHCEKDMQGIILFMKQHQSICSVSGH